MWESPQKDVVSEKHMRSSSGMQFATLPPAVGSGTCQVHHTAAHEWPQDDLERLKYRQASAHLPTVPIQALPARQAVLHMNHLTDKMPVSQSDAECTA